MNNQYDIIIIGAGPAGLMCAHALKDSNLSVLLIEKKSIIGPKPCGGGLTHLDTAFNIPPNLTREFANQEIYVGKKKYNINLNNPLSMISRFDLGQYLLDQIEGSQNITVHLNTLVTEINNDSITTNNGDIISFKHLVGADGSHSMVRRHIGLVNKICLGIYYDIPKVTKTCAWYVDKRTLKTGYIWVFPHKDCTNIGIYFDPDIMEHEKAEELLHSFLRKNGFFYEGEELKGCPIAYHYQGCVFGNKYLGGDAAGLASKLTGEGISFALTSGQEIARRILNPQYDMHDLEAVLKVKRRQEKGLRILRTVSFIQTPLVHFCALLLKTKRFQSYIGN